MAASKPGVAGLYRVATELRGLTDAVIVGVSGGKDSVAVLDVVREVGFPRVAAYFMYIVPGLSFQERYLEYLERRYDIEIIRLPHWMLSTFYRYASYRPDTNVSLDCPVIKAGDIDAEVRERTGIKWIVDGQRIDESLERRGMIKPCRGIDLKRRRAFPIAYWSTKTVLAYLKARNIPLAPEYRYHGRSFGSFRIEDLGGIRHHFPEDYQRILKVFPYAEAVAKREEFAREKNPIPEVRERRDPPPRDQKRPV